jgi:Domain of unknown function (DUF5667)
VSSPFPERRRADRLDEMLRFAANGRRQHRHTDLDAELKPLADLAMSLAGAPAPAPTEDFRTGLRALLLANIEREGIGATAIRVPRSTEATMPAHRTNDRTNDRPIVPAEPARSVRDRGGRTRAAILLGVTAGALALSGVSLASTDSVPGDALYSVKRSSEQAQLVLAGSDAGRGQLHLEFAKSRQVEARHVPADATDGVLDDMDGEARAGTRLLLSAAWQDRDGGTVASVTAFVAQQRSELTQLRLDLPRVVDRLRESLDLLRDIETRANQVRAAILSGCADVQYDELGPEPHC